MSFLSDLDSPEYGPAIVLKNWRAGIIQAFPDNMQPHVIRRYKQVTKQSGYVQANHWLRKLKETVVDRLLKCGDFRLTHDDQALRDWADVQAERISKARNKDDFLIAADLCERLCEFYGFCLPVDPDHPKTKNSDILAMVLKLETPGWWRRKMRTRRNQSIDQAARLLGLIHANGQCYLSHEALGLRLKQKTRNRALLESLQAVNQHGYTALLSELADVSVSKPAIRKAEMMTRLRGFEEVADSLGHVAEFCTLTCPSKYHARSSKKGLNPKYRGYTPKQANDYLVEVWTGIRKELNEAGIRIYGFRTVEPHQDGCPHWHMLMYMQPEHRDIVKTICHKHARKVDGTEAGARKRRCVFKQIDKRKGTATGYIAKYISKGIDGEHVGVDHYGHDAKTSAARITEWAGVWCIRQFQQIGGAPVSVWRELRRVSAEQMAEWEHLIGKALPAVLHRARELADWGEWAKYTMLQGGPIIPRALRPLKVWRMNTPALRWQEGYNPHTQEAGPFRLGQYGDLLEVIKGVKAGIDGLLTRFFHWEVKPVHSKAFDFEEANASPWTRVNNCPEPQVSPPEAEKIRQEVTQQSVSEMVDFIEEWEEAHGKPWHFVTPEEKADLRFSPRHSEPWDDTKTLESLFQLQETSWNTPPPPDLPPPDGLFFDNGEYGYV
ncbi:replication endonuclease [Oceanospirillum sediminis]|uniref:Replication endonuclease n=1 Tax=Oceanospirillum sediminis TaxID=2760088 RepID=A0A839IN29_9GAMM|nr:replication endonuclease [Oceanospirillum sediminis]MBB1485909.1 replication endonuclease [Oceanospirillum sediminis]